jgi:hypothetical protein
MSQQRTKKQHFVPRFYLDHFKDANAMIWTYDKKSESPAGNVRSASPENTAVNTNFYSVQNADGSYNDVVENLLADFESDVAPIYGSLLGGEVPKGLEKDKMAVFFAALYARSPAQINSAAWLLGALAQVTTGATLSSREIFDETMDRTERENGSEPTTRQQRDEIFDMMGDKDRFTMTVLQKAGLMSIASIEPVMEVFRRMHWILVESPDQHIVTSDNPVVKINPNPHPFYGDGGFAMKDVFVTVPLSSLMMLEMSWKESPKAGVFRADRDRGRLYNRQRAAFAERYVYSSRADSGIGALAKKNKDNGVKMRMDGPKLSKIEIRRKLA